MVPAIENKGGMFWLALIGKPRWGVFCNYRVDGGMHTQWICECDVPSACLSALSTCSSHLYSVYKTALSSVPCDPGIRSLTIVSRRQMLDQHVTQGRLWVCSDQRRQDNPV